MTESRFAPIPCQILVDPPLPGAWNMALDEVLLQRAARDGIATLRCYRWQEPTLSLGYFQLVADRRQHPPSEGAAIVRRPSGGGAILHDGELTYSLTLPSNHPLAARSNELYRVTHRLILTLLDSLRTDASPEGQLVLADPDASAKPPVEPFLCFLRRSTGDILWQLPATPGREATDFKVVGSAQRRHRGAVLQHGSILLFRSPLAPDLPGWNDLVPQTVTPEWVSTQLTVELPQTLALQTVEAEITTEMRTAISNLASSKYAADAWTHRR